MTGSETKMTRAQLAEANSRLYEKLASQDSAQVKSAAEIMTKYTRFRIREDGFWRKVLPIEHLPNEQINRLPNTDIPVYIQDREPHTPAAKSVPFGTLPDTFFIRGPRYMVVFERILSRKFSQDVSKLKTYQMDIRAIMSDQAIKDLMAEEDTKGIRSVNSILVSPGAVLPTSGVAQWQQIADGVSRDSLWSAKKVLPSTPSKLPAKTILLNHLTIHEVCKFDFQEQGGGTVSADIMQKGWSMVEYLGSTLIITIKDTLIPDNALYMFASPDALGLHLYLEDATLFVKAEAFNIEFFMYEETGSTIGNANAVARVDIV